MVWQNNIANQFETVNWDRLAARTTAHLIKLKKQWCLASIKYELLPTDNRELWLMEKFS